MGMEVDGQVWVWVLQNGCIFSMKEQGHNLRARMGRKTLQEVGENKDQRKRLCPYGALLCLRPVSTDVYFFPLPCIAKGVDA